MSGASAASGREALFYHLTLRSLEAAAPELLEKCVARGWRVTLRAGSPERAAALSHHLWTYDDASFLPHGDATDGRAERQPIYVTAGTETPNDPEVLFVVDGAPAGAAEFARFARVVTMFDGGDEAAVARARDQWRLALSTGATCVYWAQTSRGGWEKKAGSGG